MGPGFHPFIHTAGVCVRSRSVAKGSSASHTSRVFVMSRRVAKISSDFRFSNTEVKNPHCRSMRYKSQCGERLVRLSTSRADDTWGASPWESRSSPGNKQNAISYEVAFLCLVILKCGAGVPPVRSTLQECASRVAMRRKSHYKAISLESPVLLTAL